MRLYFPLLPAMFFRVGHVYVQPVWREVPKGWALHSAERQSGGKGGWWTLPSGAAKKGNC